MSESWCGLDEYVVAFEAMRASHDEVRLADFLPPSNHPERSTVVVELLRVDLEYGWEQGQPPDIEQYRRWFPEVLEVPEHWERVVFEEYRLRRRAGDGVTRQEYAATYAITTDDWPELPWGRPITRQRYPMTWRVCRTLRDMTWAFKPS